MRHPWQRLRGTWAHPRGVCEPEARAVLAGGCPLESGLDKPHTVLNPEPCKLHWGHMLWVAYAWSLAVMLALHHWPVVCAKEALNHPLSSRDPFKTSQLVFSRTVRY